jgi:superfamily II DNA or RNA helicase
MIVDNILTLDRDELTRKQWAKLFARLTFTDGEGRDIHCFRVRQRSGTVEIPRGAWYLPEFEHIVYEDRRSCPRMPDLAFALTLDDIAKSKNFKGQSAAVEAMLEQEQGLIVRMPGSGKSQIVLNFVARCETRSIVIVHTQDLIDQWVLYAQRAIPDIDIGVIQGPNYKIGHLTIASVQTLVDYVDFSEPEWWEQFGATIVDETHHAPADTWNLILNNSTSRYRIGVTATEKRADKRDPEVKFLIGPVIHRGEFEPEVPTEVVPVKTGYYFPYRGSFDWQKLVNDLVRNPARNKLIAEHADKEVLAGNSVLILSRRIEQLELIEKEMKTNRHVILAASGRANVPRAKRKQLQKDFRRGKVRCVLATQLADEGLDVPRLNRVFLVHPGKAEGRIIQQVGRALRAHTDKVDAKVLDFVDDRVSVLRKQWMWRKQAYKGMKIPVKKRKRGDNDVLDKIGKRLVQNLKPKRSTRSRATDRRT